MEQLIPALFKTPWIIVLVLVFIFVIFLIALIQGREINLWLLKIGPKPKEEERPSGGKEAQESSGRPEGIKAARPEAKGPEENPKVGGSGELPQEPPRSNVLEQNPGATDISEESRRRMEGVKKLMAPASQLCPTGASEAEITRVAIELYLASSEIRKKPTSPEKGTTIQ